MHVKKTKTCTKCGKTKTLEEFHHTKASKDGYTWQCAECRRKNSKRDRDSKLYDPREIYRQLVSVNKSKNRKTVHISEDDFVDWYASQDRVCRYCDIPEEHVMLLTEHYKRNRQKLTIDCKINDLEYREGNIVLACSRCNRTKGSLWDDITFREIAQKYIKPIWEKLLLDKNLCSC